MRQIPKPYELYRHFKGDTYQILAIAMHSETEEKLVVYQGLYGECPIYARPLEMFLEKVDKVKYPDAMQEYRFEQVTSVAKESAAQVEAVNTMKAGHMEPTKEVAQEAEPEETEPEAEELQLDPMVLAFLDADSYARKLEILTGLQYRITDDMITTMAVACDVEVPEGTISERYKGLQTCLLTLQKYECNRLR